MLTVLDEVLERAGPGTSAPRYKAGDRVIWTALRNSPQHYMPDQKISGTVICVFDNSGTPTYRIRLDLAWNEHAISQTTGELIVVGNVRESRLMAHAEQRVNCSPELNNATIKSGLD